MVILPSAKSNFVRIWGIGLLLTLWAGTENEEDVSNYAWLNGSGGIKEVMLKASNAAGLFDMSGNLQELTWSLYNPEGSNTGFVCRGGSFCNLSSGITLTRRALTSVSYRGWDSGFRIVRNVD